MIKREITEHLLKLAEQFPVVAVMGPRQSGKTTLVKELFSDYAYVSLEDIDMRLAAQEDPRNFFATYSKKKGLIIDEIQEVPDLLSYMQGIVDQSYRPGYFIITGSQNFLIHEKITQTLAGRIAMLTLLPLTINELQQAHMLPDLNEFLLKGCYPRLYAQPIDLHTWLSYYISTYVEKDVRQITKITNVLSFQKFLKLCAARVGNILNYADLARDADVSPNTAKEWISLLETSYIIKLVQPYYKNFNKRVIKSPKLYFYDTGLVCSLLGIRNAEELAINPIRGHLFESLIMSQLFKYRFNEGELPNIYFWRDTQGHEIDCLVEKRFGEVVPVEIKSRMTMSDEFFKELKKWQEITQQQDKSYVVYAGEEDFQRQSGHVISWRNLSAMLQDIHT